MITKYEQYITEGYKEIDEIYFLSDEIIEYFSKNSDKFYKELKKEDYTYENLKEIIDINKYNMLKDFINNFNLDVVFYKVNNENLKGEFSPENYDEYEPQGAILINQKNPEFMKNLQKGYAKYDDNEYEILKYALSNTFRGTIVHELQHSYDYFRSKGNFSKSKQTTEYRKQVDKDNIDNGLSPTAQLLSAKLPHEQWAIFTQVIQEIDFNTDFNNVLKQFKTKYRNYNQLDEKQKKRLYNVLYQYYDNKNDKLTETIKNLLVGPKEDEVIRNLQQKLDDGKIDIFDFYVKCRFLNLKGGN